jgi:hypothetical protein
MASAPCDPLADHLLTPETQRFCSSATSPRRWPGVRSMDRALPGNNAVSTVRTTKTFGYPSCTRR